MKSFYSTWILAAAVGGAGIAGLLFFNLLPLPKGQESRLLASHIPQVSSDKISTDNQCNSRLIGDALAYEIPAINVKPLPNVIHPRELRIQKNALPALHSLSSSSQKIYLNFVGCQSALWGGSYVAQSPAYDIDGDTSTFSATEVSNIQTIWQRVSEDYIPFNLDVTTENPGSFGAKQAVEVCIGGNGSWYGPLGGVAFLQVWSNPDPAFHRAWIFEDNLGNGDVKFTAEAISHETGHTFGLGHHGDYDKNCNLVSSYSYGTGSGETGWAPIMGVGYSQNWVTWHNSGPQYCSAQKDLETITSEKNGVSYRPDDRGSTLNSATALAVSSDGSSLTGSGIISHPNDVDLFSFTTGAGVITFDGKNFETGPNLDISLRLLDSSGTEILHANPAETLDASFSTTVDSGRYFVEVAAGPRYGSLGQYTILGAVASSNGATPTPQPTATQTPSPTPTATATATPTVFVSSTTPPTPPPTSTVAYPRATPTVVTSSSARPQKPQTPRSAFTSTTARVLMSGGFVKYQVKVESSGCRARSLITNSKSVIIKLQSRMGQLTYRVKNNAGWSPFSEAIGLHHSSERGLGIRCSIT